MLSESHEYVLAEDKFSASNVQGDRLEINLATY